MITSEGIYMKKEIIKEFLNEIKINIETIDGGCGNCVGSFCEGVNESIEKYDLKISLNGDDDAERCGIEISEL